MKINIFFEEMSIPDQILNLKNEIYQSLMKYIKKNYRKLKKSNKEINFIFIEKKEPKYPENSIIIIFTRMRDLNKLSTYNFFKNKFSRLIDDKFCEDKKVNFNIYRPVPMIIIGLEDIAGVYKYNGNEKKPEYVEQKRENASNSEDEKSNYEKLIDSLNLDKRVLFFDSSIWQRYVPLNEDFEERFEKTLKEICLYHELGLYQLTVAAEYLEFRTRMMLNSFLAPLKEGHARNISPFHFHSETLMRERAKEEFEKFKDSDIHWKFLLVDDFADAWLTKRKSGKSSDDKYKRTKAEILSEILNSFDPKLKSITDIEPVMKNEEGENKKEKPHENVIAGFNDKIKGKQFDIILLDYLLGEGQNSDREKCTQILEEIENHAVKRKKGQISSKYENNGPLDKFWFFPISAFSYAMLDDIREKGMGHHTDLWELSSGADPINTPNLFLYKLFRFMNQQIKEAGQFKIKNTWNGGKDEEKMRDLYDFLKFYFEDKDDENIRTKAKRCYPDFVEMHGKFEKLSKQRKAEQKGFITSILKTYYKGHSESFFEHLQHLIFLLAYGSAVQAPAMWEEFQFIKNNIKKSDLDGELKSVFINIGKYIVELSRH